MVFLAARLTKGLKGVLLAKYAPELEQNCRHYTKILVLVSTRIGIG